MKSEKKKKKEGISFRAVGKAFALVALYKPFQGITLFVYILAFFLFHLVQQSKKLHSVSW